MTLGILMRAYDSDDHEPRHTDEPLTLSIHLGKHAIVFVPLSPFLVSFLGHELSEDGSRDLVCVLACENVLAELTCL